MTFWASQIDASVAVKAALSSIPRQLLVHHIANWIRGELSLESDATGGVLGILYVRV